MSKNVAETIECILSSVEVFTCPKICTQQMLVHKSKMSGIQHKMLYIYIIKIQAIFVPIINKDILSSYKAKRPVSAKSKCNITLQQQQKLVTKWLKHFFSFYNTFLSSNKLWQRCIYKINNLFNVVLADPCQRSIGLLFCSLIMTPWYPVTL